MYRVHRLDNELARVLPSGSLFSVGGRVRDEIRAETDGERPADSDLDYVVTGVALPDLLQRLSRLGHVDVVGAAFAVVKLTVLGQTVDVALPRRERSTGPAHRDFAVQSGPEVPLHDDLSRRDFRMNMIARSLPGGELVDPFDGQADIKARRIDLLHPSAFQEDPLRMLRAAQFSARFGYAPTPRTSDAMRAAAPLVATVSTERITAELSKLLEHSARPSVGLDLLRETGVLQYVWPELIEGVGVEQNEWHAYDVWNHAMATVDAVPAGDLTLRVAALFHDIGKPRTKDGPHFYRHETVGADMALAMLGRFHFGSDVNQRVGLLVRNHMFSTDPGMTDPSVRRFIRRIGPENTERLFALRAADVAGSGLPKRGNHNERFADRVRAEIERQPAFSIRDLAIGGKDVIAALVRRGEAQAGFRGDARVGDALHWLFEQVTEEPERNERTALLSLLERHLNRCGAPATRVRARSQQE